MASFSSTPVSSLLFKLSGTRRSIDNWKSIMEKLVKKVANFTKSWTIELYCTELSGDDKTRTCLIIKLDRCIIDH